MVAKYQPRKFYVYALFDENGIVCYIGKGKGRRLEQHEWDTQTRNWRKRAFIKRTLKFLGDVPKVKVRTGLTEAEAFEIEVALIKAIGRLDLGTGPLTNMSDGGVGGDLGKYVKRAKANWTDDERKKHSETYRQATKKTWASLSEEQRIAWKADLVKRGIAARKRLREIDPTYEKRRGKKISQGYARRTPEQRAETARKSLEANPPEARSKSAKIWHATRTAEERSETIRKGWRNLTPEERSARARGPNFNHEERSAQVIRQQANLTPKQQVERAQRAQQIGKNTRWINNGKINRRLKQTESLPNGWVYGKIPRS